MVFVCTSDLFWLAAVVIVVVAADVVAVAVVVVVDDVSTLFDQTLKVTLFKLALVYPLKTT